MIRLILIAFSASLLLAGASCRSASCNTARNNSKLIAGNYDFGKKKEAKKYKKKNRRSY
jgi:hypothetical protein